MKTTSRVQEPTASAEPMPAEEASATWLPLMEMMEGRTRLAWTEREKAAALLAASPAWGPKVRPPVQAPTEWSSSWEDSQ